MTKRDRKINFQVFGRLQRPETPLPVIPLWRGVNSAPRMTGRQKGKFRPSEPGVACHCAQLPMYAACGVYAASPFAIPQVKRSACAGLDAEAAGSPRSKNRVKLHPCASGQIGKAKGLKIRNRPRWFPLSKIVKDRV